MDTFSNSNSHHQAAAIAILSPPSRYCHWCCFTDMVKTRNNEILLKEALNKEQEEVEGEHNDAKSEVSITQPVQRLPFFDDLPIEITQQIFDFVVNNAEIYRTCNRVCKSWYNLISYSVALFDARLLRSDNDTLIDRKRERETFLKIPGAIARLQSLARKSQGVFSRKGVKLILCEHDENQPPNLFWQHVVPNNSGHFDRHVSPKLHAFFEANRCLYEMPYSFHKVVDTSGRNSERKPKTGLFFDWDDDDDERYGNFGHNRGGEGWWTLFNLEKLLANSGESNTCFPELFDVLKIPFTFVLAYCYSIPSIYQRAIFYDANLNKIPREKGFHFCANENDDCSLVVARYPSGLRYVAVPDKILGLRFVPPGHCSVDD